MSGTVLRQLATATGLVLLCAAALRYATRVPAVVPDSAPATEFSAARAMTHVRAIAQRPHPSGSIDHERVRAYLMEQLATLGLTPVLQRTTAVGTRYPAAGVVSNVLGRLAGTRAGGHAVLLMAHYDGVAASPGAGDDASGTAVLLETLRALAAGPRLTNDVIVLLTDAEESGLLGAAAFVKEHPWAQQVGVALNFEARGTHGPSLMFETGPGNLDMARALRRAGGRMARATSLSTAVYRQLPNDTDLSELAVLARPAMNFAFIGGVQRYHTEEDDSGHLDPRSVQAHGDQALALARDLANRPLPRPVTGDAVFFDLPLLGLVVYPESWAMAFAALAVALVVVAIGRLRRAEPRWWRDVLVGAAGLILALPLAVGAAIALSQLLVRLHVAIGSGSPTWSGLYLAAVATLSLTIALAFHALARRFASSPDARGLHAGALLVWGVLAIVVTVAAPGVSFLLAWPLLFAASAALVAQLVRGAFIARLDIWIAATVTIFLLVPTLYLMAGVALGLGAVAAAVVSAFTVLGAFALVPIMEDVRGARWWAAPAAAGAATLTLLVIGAATVRFDADDPARSSLVYARDAASNTAWLAGSGSAPIARAHLRSAQEGLPDASASVPPVVPRWVARRAGGSRPAPAPIVELPPPSMSVISDSVDDDARRIAVRVRPGAAVLALELSVDSAAVLSAAVSGRGIDRSRYRRSSPRWTLQFVAPADSGFTLEIAVPAGARPILNVVSMRAGIPAAIVIPPRPAGLLASQNGDISLAFARLRL